MIGVAPSRLDSAASKPASSRRLLSAAILAKALRVRRRGNGKPVDSDAPIDKTIVRFSGNFRNFLEKLQSV
ncbi:hypothetical protein CASFOL_028087 [Castilleja foliolosa]|uniref:Uncharacterized protein n=1 Tax=Castilleja foliolosa TaxID=1961234 RepID=A0ABD3CGT1_9LAMI